MRHSLAHSVDPHFEKVDALCEKIGSFASLPRGWDGEEAPPPSREVFVIACKLIRELPQEAGLPSVAPAPDGGIGLTWTNGPKQLNAKLYTDSHLVWVKRLEQGGRFLPGAEIDLGVESYPDDFVKEVVSLYR